MRLGGRGGGGEQSCVRVTAMITYRESEEWSLAHCPLQLQPTRLTELGRRMTTAAGGEV